MPYYREYFNNNSTLHTTQSNGGAVQEYPLVLEDAVLTGWRSRAHSDAFYSTEVNEKTFDPYAYFLEQGSKTKYAKRLAERNMAVQGDPDRGHAFELSKYTLSVPAVSVTSVRKSSAGIFTRVIKNPVFGVSGVSTYRKLANPASSLPTFAQQAYSRVAPTAKVFDAAQFLGELREGLPTLAIASFKSSARVFQGLGSDYLNVEFGWKPFLNDLINAGKALAGATNLLSGSGERVHRSYGTPTVYTSDIQQSDLSINLTDWLGHPGQRETAFGLPLLPLGNGMAPNGSYYFIRTSERRQWFEGEFTNFFRLGFDPSSFLDRLDQLVNVKMTPSVLWELAPWSWLVDWHLRIGDSIRAQELVANDLLVMHYGYAMEHTVLSELMSIDMSANARTNPGTSSYTYWPDLPNSISYVSRTEYKRRIRANPYGFRTGGTSALSVGQLGILGALGLTRLK